VLGAVAGHVVAGISDMGTRIEQAMQHADTAEIERDAKAAGQAPASD
jgi:hypothetical protein